MMIYDELSYTYYKNKPFAIYDLLYTVALSHNRQYKNKSITIFNKNIPNRFINNQTKKC